MKDIFGILLTLAIIGVFGFGYISNIIWLFDNWGVIEFGSKFLNIVGTFIPPLGSILGIIHFF
ncbi:MAG: hypothetical protein ISR67_01205 [Sulfurimonas sp.]|nr:hypothetical protein [Sulfurimonas sp.]